MLCSVPSCDNPGAWPGERYCFRHYLVPRARRVLAGDRADEPFTGWPRRFRVIGRTR